MPELPEVETIRLQLNQVLTGLRVTGVKILNKKSFIGEAEKVLEKKVLGVERRGKMILIRLEGGFFLLIHLKLTGQLIYREKNGQTDAYKDENGGVFAVKQLPNKFTRVILEFDNGGRLYFNDLRIFGWIRVVEGDEKLEFEKLGPEANDSESFTLDYFKKILAKTKKPIKLVIMDQEKISGVGNIYANEALFEAGILPTKEASSLNENEVKKLREAILGILQKAIRYKGTSDKDEAYRQITGEKGEFQRYLKVYGRDGERCLRCGGRIRKVQLGGRGTYYCDSCQK